MQPQSLRFKHPPPPEIFKHEVINSKVFHRWGGLKQRGKSLLDAFSSDHSQHLIFHGCSCDRGHENKNCGKRNQSSDCCAIAQPEDTLTKHHLCSINTSTERFITLTLSLINNWRWRPACQRCSQSKVPRRDWLSLSVYTLTIRLTHP